jgi:hypothetical protein
MIVHATIMPQRRRFATGSGATKRLATKRHATKRHKKARERRHKENISILLRFGQIELNAECGMRNVGPVGFRNVESSKGMRIVDFGMERALVKVGWKFLSDTR